MITEAPPRAPAPAPRPGPAAPGRRGVPAALIGLVALCVFASGSFFAVKAAYGGFGHYYRLTVDVARAGQQLQAGSDVRMRGVRVGTVDRIDLVGPRTVRLTLQLEDRYRVPASAQAVITLKTLLGAKFVDLRFPAYAGPFLSSGDRIHASHVGPELEDALADGVNVLDAIRPSDIGTVVEQLAVGARGHGEDVARGLHANADLADLFARTLQPQLQSLHDFAVTFHALRDRGEDLNAMAGAINQGVPVYASEAAQRDLRAALTAVTPFANDLADLLIYQKPDWDRLMDDGDAVLATIAARQGGLRDLVVGLYRYVFKLSGPPFEAPFLKGSAAAGFVNFMGGNNSAETHRQICEAFPLDIRNHLAFCGGH